MSDLLPSGWGRRLALAAGAGILATALVVALIAQVSHSAHVLDHLRHATPGWLVVCAAGEVIAYAGYLAGYRAMARLHGGPRLPASVALRVVALAFGAFALATAVGGLSVDFWALHEAGEPPARASARVIAFETLRWAVLALATWLAALAALLGLSRSVGTVLPVAWLVVVPACFAGGLWVSAARRRDRLGSAGARSHSWIRRAFAAAVDALVYLRILVSARSEGLRRRALGGSLLFWAGDLLCAWAALRAFGARVGVAPLLLGYATGYVSEAVPLPAGGAGGVDAAMTGGFVLAGAPLGAALLGAVTFRVFSFWLPAMVAVPSMLGARGLRDRLQEIAVRRGHA
ncbi:MAG TPA: lysylphosphatidylglycerol synthase domain-containing protein [Solirubrobacteraceae bacterium]|nr:lysylphosphatidylglycerol synthase domain-containing protein [Solirubrobacteraceae bacterium]